MSSSTSPNDAEVSAVNDRLASLEVTDSQAIKKGSDTSAGVAARLSGEGERVLDHDLWNPHPPTEDCPVCFVPLPLDQVESTYRVCCGKLICNGCSAETIRARKVINAKRARKKLPPLDTWVCPFCQTVADDSEPEYEERIRKGDEIAACSLAHKYRDGDTLYDIPKDEARFLEFIHHAADDLGSSVAMASLGEAYLFGIHEFAKDEKKGRNYLENAIKIGNVPARFVIGRVEAENGNVEIAIRHWKLAAAAGDNHSTKQLWKRFYLGAFEKAELEETLRAHKAACDSMNSEERKRYALWGKAEVEGDDLLTSPLRNYYAGIIKAKELDLALKALQKTDS